MFSHSWWCFEVYLLAHFKSTQLGFFFLIYWKQSFSYFVILIPVQTLNGTNSSFPETLSLKHCYIYQANLQSKK